MEVLARHIHKTAAGLSQTFAVGEQLGEHCSTSAQRRPVTFTRSVSSSITSEQLFTIGDGSFDPTKITRMIYQYAIDKHIFLDTVAAEWMDYLRMVGRTPAEWHPIVAQVLGANSKTTVGLNRVTAVPPRMILDALKSQFTTQHDLFPYIMTDFICSHWAPLGWTLKDAPLVYKVARGSMFPNYRALVDLQRAHDIRSSLEALASLDMQFVEDTIKQKRALTLNLVATTMAESINRAVETKAGSYDAEAIVSEVLVILGRIWNPTTPNALYPEERIRKHPIIEELISNLGLFLAYQDMAAVNPSAQTQFDISTVTDVILPRFNSALHELSPFVVRPISDVTSYLGQKSARDHMGRPGNIVVYEDWDFSTDTEVFVPVMRTSKGNERFLVVDPKMSESVRNALAPVSKLLSVPSMVRSVIATYQTVAAQDRYAPDTGPVVTMLFPSIDERIVGKDLTVNDVEHVLRTGLRPKKDDLSDDEAQVVSRQLAEIRFDYYATVMHAAVMAADSLGVSPSGKPGHACSQLYVVFDKATTVVTPLSKSAIQSGSLTSSEPLEILCYREDCDPLNTLRHRAIELSQHDNSLHLWPWWNYAKPLATTADYEATVRGQKYCVPITEYQAFGMSGRRSRLRMITPTIARAIVKQWVSSFLSNQSFTQRQEKKVKDDLVKTALTARRTANAIHFALKIASVGSQGVGPVIKGLVQQGLAQEMYAGGLIDDYADTHVGIQKQKLDIWAGVVSMRMLGLLDDEDTQKIQSELAATNALAMIGSFDVQNAG